MKFFDINKFPKEKGLIVFPISMAKISNSQGIDQALSWIKFFENKVLRAGIGLAFIYTDFLYLYNPGTASDLKKKFMQLAYSHKNGIMKSISADIKYIPEAFSFLTRNQLYLSYDKFYDELQKLIKLYDTDPLLKQYVKDDIKATGRRLTKNQIHFTLEEYLMTYLITKGKIRIHNEYIGDAYNWILVCYPGSTAKTLGYLYQNTIFKYLNDKNVFENCFYNLEKKILYDHKKMDLNEYKYE